MKIAQLQLRFPRQEIPSERFIGVFGSHQLAWRKLCIEWLGLLGIQPSSVYDSTEPGWSVVDNMSGELLQEWIDELVARQQNALHYCTCVILSMDVRTRNWPTDAVRSLANRSCPAPIDSVVANIYATRCEFGWLAGTAKPTFVWIPDDLPGVNYLRSICKLHENMRPVDSIQEGAELASEYILSS